MHHDPPEHHRLESITMLTAPQHQIPVLLDTQPFILHYQVTVSNSNDLSPHMPSLAMQSTFREELFSPAARECSGDTVSQLVLVHRCVEEWICLNLLLIRRIL
jgi:hypothetical protein